jgi:hypothetical protein
LENPTAGLVSVSHPTPLAWSEVALFISNQRKKPRKTGALSIPVMRRQVPTRQGDGRYRARTCDLQRVIGPFAHAKKFGKVFNFKHFTLGKFICKYSHFVAFIRTASRKSRAKTEVATIQRV